MMEDLQFLNESQLSEFIGDRTVYRTDLETCAPNSPPYTFKKNLRSRENMMSVIAFYIYFGRRAFRASPQVLRLSELPWFRKVASNRYVYRNLDNLNKIPEGLSAVRYLEGSPMAHPECRAAASALRPVLIGSGKLGAVRTQLTPLAIRTNSPSDVIAAPFL
ncbi:jg27116 [Pararge aegeria aegeria]|uniref:Jg27116 protein n=1 Tax=Pararge aegeria aegeria TaxID=348720 RepID=A0A8S4QPT4_9NEOP|nr:jg27116 [Pararge aegeria aegeria]